MRCQWCHNPESLEKIPSLQFTPEKCIGCGKCAEACKFGAHRIEDPGLHIFRRELCKKCFACTEVCYAGALERCGYEKMTSQVVKEALRDRRLFTISKGGVTFSGGEPLLQADSVAEAAKQLKESGVHVAIDTAANVPWEAFEKTAPFADLYLIDVKLNSEQKHKEFTGVSNRLIQENIRKIVRVKPVFIRIPVIGGVNDNEEELSGITDFLKDAGGLIKQIELLTYHDLGVVKYASLGMVAHEFYTPEPADMQKFSALLSRTGIPVYIA